MLPVVSLRVRADRAYGLTEIVDHRNSCALIKSFNHKKIHDATCHGILDGKMRMYKEQSQLFDTVKAFD